MQKLININLKNIFLKLNQFSWEFFWIIMGFVFQFLAGIVLIKVLTHFLSPSDYGNYNLFNSVVQFCEIVLLSPFLQGASRFAYMFNEIYTSFVWARNICFKIIFILAIFSIITFVLNLKLSFVNNVMIIVFPAIVFFDIARDLILGFFGMNRDRKAVSIYKTLDQIIRILIVLLLAYFSIVSINNVLYVNIFVGVFLCIFLIFKLKKTITPLVDINELITDSQITLLKNNVLKYAIPFSLLSIFIWAQTWADRWILKTFLDTKDVGIYSSNSQIANIPFIAISAVVITFFSPIFFKQAENINSIESLKVLKSRINKVVYFYILVSILVVIVFYFAQNFVLELAIPSTFFLKNSEFIFIVIGWSFFQVAQVQSSLIFYSAAQMNLLLYINLITGLVFMFLLVILIKQFGLFGAAISFAISNGLKVILLASFTNYCWEKFYLLKNQNV